MTLTQPREQTTLLRYGRPAQFIRWHQARDGRWYPEILQGRYDHCDTSGWWITTTDGLIHLPEDDWAIYRN